MAWPKKVSFHLRRAWGQTRGTHRDGLSRFEADSDAQRMIDLDPARLLGRYVPGHDHRGQRAEPLMARRGTWAFWTMANWGSPRAAETALDKQTTPAPRWSKPSGVRPVR